jgi:hypothetical protein
VWRPCGIFHVSISNKNPPSVDVSFKNIRERYSEEGRRLEYEMKFEFFQSLILERNKIGLCPGFKRADDAPGPPPQFASQVTSNSLKQ